MMGRSGNNELEKIGKETMAAELKPQLLKLEVKLSLCLIN
jgi:hypothetical protein